jgi:hypothetical protein
MPKPPGNGLQIRPRAPPSLPRRGVPPRHVLHRSEDYGSLYTWLTGKARKVSPQSHLGDGLPERPIPKRTRAEFDEWFRQRMAETDAIPMPHLDAILARTPHLRDDDTDVPPSVDSL